MEMARMIKITKTTGYGDVLSLSSDDTISLERTRMSSSLEIRRVTYGTFDVNSTFSKHWLSYVQSDPKLISYIEYFINDNLCIKVDNIDSIFYSVQDLRDNNMDLIPGVCEIVKCVLR